MIDRVARASIDIQAPIDTVWAIMVELRRYHEWNPFIIAVRDAPDQMKVGARFRLRVKWANGGQADSWETVTHLTPPTTADRGPASPGDCLSNAVDSARRLDGAASSLRKKSTVRPA